MTTTKLAYTSAAIIPGGFFILAAILLARIIWARRQDEFTWPK